jgi:thiazole synthase
MDTWKVGDVELKSRLILGSGKYRDFGVMREAIRAAGAEVVTVSVRRVELKAPGHVGLLEALEGVRLLPNTAGAKTAEEAVRLARLGRALTGERWVKLEVIPDPTYLLPDPVETLKAAERLLEEGFLVLPYMGPDLVLAKRLAALGTATVMPLAAPIGSGWGVRTRALLELFARERASLPPVVVDAGLGLPSHAAEVMELGLDAVLVNTAIAEAQDPPAMAEAFRLAVEAGWMARVRVSPTLAKWEMSLRREMKALAASYPPLRPKVRTAPGLPRKYFWALPWWGWSSRPG